jgi:hypothetical protein
MTCRKAVIMPCKRVRHRVQFIGCLIAHLVVDLGLKLDPRLDDIDGGEGTVGDGATESTGKGETARAPRH